MYTPEDIRNVTFQRSVSGYKTGDVEAFLEEIAQQMEAMIKAKAAAPAPAPSAPAAPAPVKQSSISGISEEGLQNLLISAQRTADTIIADAREKASAIIAEAEQKAQASNTKLRAQLEQTQEKIKSVIEESDKKSNDLIKTATSKSDSMISAAHDSVARQQLLFDKLKISVAAYKKELITIYKKQLEIVSTMPDEVPANPADMARAVEFIIDSHPQPESFITGREQPADITPLEKAIDTAAEAEIVHEGPTAEIEHAANVNASISSEKEADALNLFEGSEENEPEKAAPSPIMVPSEESEERRKNSAEFFEEYNQDDTEDKDEPKGLFRKRKNNKRG